MDIENLLMLGKPIGVSSSGRYRYSKEFKEKVKQLYKSGRNLKDLETASQVKMSTMYTWIKTEAKPKKPKFKELAITSIPTTTINYKIIFPSGAIVSVNLDVIVKLLSRPANVT